MTELVKNVNFGKGKAGLTSVGYTLYDASGIIDVPRTIVGVYEMGTNTGIYVCNIPFPDDFVGSIFWDTGDATLLFATEEYNQLETNVRNTNDMMSGRWKVDTHTKQMIFFKDDNYTEVARYDLFDDQGVKTIASPYERRRA